MAGEVEEAPCRKDGELFSKEMDSCLNARCHLDKGVKKQELIVDVFIFPS